MSHDVLLADRRREDDVLDRCAALNRGRKLLLRFANEQWRQAVGERLAP